MSLQVYPRQHLDPTPSHAINPPGKATMLAGEVAHFMREHRAKLGRSECSQQGKAHDQVVVEPAKHSKLRNLHDRRIEVAADEHVMNLWSIELGRDFMNQIKQRGRLMALQLRAVRLGKRYPQRAQHNANEDERDPENFDYHPVE